AIVRSVRERAAGAVITLDTHEDWRPGDDVLDAARLVDVFVPSRAELTELTGCDDPERAADGLLAAGVRCVVVKLGGDGALVARPGSPPAWVPAAPAEVVDPTGAGDSFCGGFAAGLALGDDAGEAAGRGVEHLYLTGCGDSAFAGMAATLAFRRHSRLRVHARHALDFARYEVRYLPPGSALLAISYSGKVGRTIEAARQASSFGTPVIALTGDVAGPLAAAADRILPIEVPTLGFSPGTSTYVGMLGTLIELARRTPRDGAEDALRAACEQLAGQAAKTLDGCHD